MQKLLLIGFWRYSKLEGIIVFSTYIRMVNNFFIIHFREKLYKQNMFFFLKNVFVREDFLSTIKKMSYRK